MGNHGVGSLRHVIGPPLEQGKLEWEEYSHFGMITRLQAGASGLPFLPRSNRRNRSRKVNLNIKAIPIHTVARM